MLHSLSHFSLWQPKMSFHSHMVGVSFNVSFQLTPISIATSFPHGNYLILYLILPRSLFHAIFHSFWQIFQLNFHFFMVATSLSLDSVSFPFGSCFMQYFIPPGIYFDQIFMSSWRVLHSLLYFVSFPSGSFSCNISFLLALTLLSPMSSAGICRIPTGMSEFHGILTESIWLEPQPFWFSIPWNFQQNPMESSGISWNPGASRNGFHWNPLECVGIHWNSHISGEFQQIPTDSQGFQCLPLLLL